MRFRRAKFWLALSLPLLLAVILWRVNYWRPKPAPFLRISANVAGDFAAGGTGSHTRIWIENRRTEKLRWVEAPLRPAFERSTMRVSPDGESLSWNESDNSLRQETFLAQSFLWHKGKTRKIADEMWIGCMFSSDSEFIAFDGGNIRAFNPKTGKNTWSWSLFSQFSGDTPFVFDVQTSRFLQLTRISGGHQLESFNWKTHRKTTRKITPTFALNLQFSPHGKWIHSLGGGGIAQNENDFLLTMRSTRNPKFLWTHTLPSTRNPEPGELNRDALFSSDESLFAVDSDRKIFIFQTQTGELLRWLPSPPGILVLWRFSPDNSEIWSQSEDGKFWRQRAR